MKVIQISDTHINQDPESKLCGLAINSDETLIKVLDLVIKEKPDLVLATGDLSQDGSIESYQRLKQILKKLPCNVYTIYGNHDNPTHFDKHLLGDNIYKQDVLETQIGNFIFLNSREDGSESGYLDQLNKKHLIESLAKYNDCIIVIHHHIVAFGTFIDKYILKNNHELMDIIKSYQTKIKLCITGHVHNFYQKRIENVPIYSSISTCIQFAKTKDMDIDKKNPGFMLYQFDKDKYTVTEKQVI